MTSTLSNIGSEIYPKDCEAGWIATVGLGLPYIVDSMIKIGEKL